LIFKLATSFKKHIYLKDFVHKTAENIRTRHDKIQEYDKVIKLAKDYIRSSYTTFW